MKLTSRQENMANAYLRGVASQMERYLSPEERAHKLGELQQHIQQRLEALNQEDLADSEVDAVLKSVGTMFSQRLDESGMRKKLNPQFVLMLSTDDKRWLGVCGGLAARFGLESWMVRANFLVLAIPLTPLALLVYFGLYCWMYFQSERGRLPKFNYLLPAWRFAYTLVVINVLFHVAENLRTFIFYAHTKYLEREVPPLGDWDWIANWNGSCANWALVYGLPFALLSGTPLQGGWGESLKRVPWALMTLYFIAISFGLASILVGIILDFVDEFTGDPSLIFRIFDLGQ